VRFERRIAMPEGYTFAVGSSGVVAEKTGAALAKYNRASLLAREAVKAWNLVTGRQDPHLAAAIASRPDAYDRILVAVREMNEPGFPWAELIMRTEQFMLESTRIIPAACDALAAGDLVRFGHQVELSQQLADRLLGNQIDQTAFLTRAARQCGAAASSAFGAGFGGAVWAMVKIDAAEEFLANWAKLYHAQFPACKGGSRFFQTQPGPAAFAL
jgi:galactokinase